MTFNAMTEHYEEITVCGKPALFTSIRMQNEKCVKDEPHSEFTKEEQQEFLKLLNRITPEQREALKKVLKSFI